MDRIYMSRVPGSERIHVEIQVNEIADLLDDFAPDADAFEATKNLHRILTDAYRVFAPELAPPSEGDQMS
ncbi:hypothetical protein [Streptomyces pseudovenezuelae]|uniref:hypothetical protein n=1 Tax=Streptomyces pseudovenezuelae TaxID=67350 RepID=UPI002E80DFCC|nr:hypothetical protein [Streptomyces pseudovenezuelae]WUA94539.1 hypothetical protein OHO81_45010 [Streptomyces pseudovenezuelae]